MSATPMQAGGHVARLRPEEDGSRPPELTCMQIMGGALWPLFINGE